MSPQFTTNISRELNTLLSEKSYSQIAVLVDENTKLHCLPIVKKTVSDALVIQIKSGEQNKTVETCTFIWDQLTITSFDRKSVLINLGGGVIGDMGGFCAATYKRGIDFINIPTTLLSQVDASVGGKLGIDFNGFKNHIGLFKNPNAILVYADFLKTLPVREIKSGYAEILKHALISSKEQWEIIKLKSVEEIDIQSIVRDSVNIKESVVKEDPLESGKRKILNFGHTVGHALESNLLGTPDHLLHGEAVAIGIICESYIAHKKDLLTMTELEEIIKTVNRNYNTAAIDKGSFEAILQLVHQDKKNAQEKVLMALPHGIGNAQWDVEVTPMEIEASLNFYNSI